MSNEPLTNIAVEPVMLIFPETFKSVFVKESKVEAEPKTKVAADIYPPDDIKSRSTFKVMFVVTDIDPEFNKSLPLAPLVLNRLALKIPVFGVII